MVVYDLDHLFFMCLFYAYCYGSGPDLCPTPSRFRVSKSITLF
jgi:hypothetical protein